MKITEVKSREILDSRGWPTVETDITIEGNITGRASVPSGASTGSNEALELRDNEKRYLGKGVLKAVNNVNTIIKENIINKDFKNFQKLDELLIKLDNTKNKTNLGANAILSVSLAYIKACAQKENKELYQYIGKNKKIPKCMFNILNGGMHADNKIEFQEFMIMVNRKTIKEQLQIASEIFHNLKNILKEQGYSTNVGDEGGFAPNLKNNEEALDTIIKAIEISGYKPKEDVLISLDIAASSFYDNNKKMYLIDNTYKTTDQMIEMYKKIIKKYPIFSIEDPLEEQDFIGFSKLTNELNTNIVGDDLYTTNKNLLQKGIENKSTNFILLKANQIGTITEMLETINLARENNINMIISHRSGETEDTFISDFAVGLGIPYMKSGSLSRGERICKYNRLLRIEENL